MFSNTKSVEINGKEVKSIILENGAILYEKENPYILSITSDKDILSYYDNDVATLTASLTKDSTPIEGEEVIFYTPNVTIGTEKYSAQDYNYIKMNLEGDGEIILPNSTQFSVQAFTEDGTNVVWEDLSKGDWKIKINNGELNFCLGTNASPSEQSSFVGNKFSIKIFSKTSNDLYEISSSYPVFFASAITQNNGQCSVVYNSQGIGDVLINVECMNLQETYDIEDAIYYNSNIITGIQVLSIPNIPINFKASFKTQYNGSNRASWLNIGENANNNIFFGQVGSTALGMFKKINGTNSSISTQNVLTSTKEYLIEFTYENGVLTLKSDNTTLTGNYTYNNRSFVSTNIGANNHMKELKIKPL